MINVTNLNFEYPGKQVLFDVSCTVAAGSITALVGPNGVGKTTLMRCIAALDIPQSGRITVDGVDVAENPRAAHGLCGYLSDFFGLYDGLTARQCLVYGAWIQGVPGAEVQKRVAEAAKVTNIEDMLDKPAGNMSRGYRQRLGIALALIHNPKVLILDEPASGMDPEARIGLSALMRRLKSEGRTIIVSSHILNELEDYCTDMLVIRDGRVADHVKLSEHESKMARVLEVKIANAAPAHAEFLKAQPHVTAVRLTDSAVLCDWTGTAEDQQKLLQALVAANIPVTGFSVVSHTLQDAYMTVTGVKA